MSVSAFDLLAARYDELWTNSPVGRWQRNAVWRRIDPLFQPGDAVLDFGCGTGEDAVHLGENGIRVLAVDSSPEMIRLAQRRGVDARMLCIEEIDQLDAQFDGALSNFGALNCVPDLRRVGAALARLIRPNGHVVVCTMGRFCLWETVHYGLRLQPGKAIRRLRQKGAAASLGVRVFYPSVREIAAAFRPGFELVDWAGVGIFVPPSYITALSRRTLAGLAAVDRRVARWPLLRAISDHRLLTFVRI